MFNPQYYQDIYLLVVTIFTVTACGKLKETKSFDADTTEIKWKYALMLAILFAVFVGWRPLNLIFGDMWAYASEYYQYEYTPFRWTFSSDSFLFILLLRFFAANSLGVGVFFFLIALIYFVGEAFALKKLFPQRTLVAFLIFLGAFSTYSYSVNGIRAGVASSIFCCAFAYREKRWFCALLLLVSWGFHHSMHVCIVAFVCVYFYNSPRSYLYIWTGALLLAILHITFFQEIFGALTDDAGAGYLVTSKGIARVGRTRYDFIFYSSIPIILGEYIRKKYNWRDSTFDFISCLYLLLNSVWLLCIHARFTNRIAYLSWQLYPIFLAYPFLTESFSQQIGVQKQNQIAVQVTYLHLGFTLAMSYIYYVFLN